MADTREATDPPNPAASEESAAPLHADRLTWAVLLGRWVDFARSAIALPDHADGKRLRESVPDIIMLQAVWFALQHLQELDAAERSLGLDRAGVLIEKHETALRKRWKDRLPKAIEELIADAGERLKADG